MNKDYRKNHNEKGSVIVAILVITIFLSSFVFSLIVLANSNLARARGRVLLLQAQYTAESGADSAIAELNSGNDTYTGTASEVEFSDASSYRSTYTVQVAPGSDDKEKIVTATGRVYAPKSSSQAYITQKIQVTIKRSTTTTASAILSRNIIEFHSGIKNVHAREVYLNGYIHMSKNTTNLIAEKITVADKNTGPENCSIGGDGNLVKPSSFTDPAQTKTRIITAYNNCINPPGNTSNENFEVTANQTNISKVHSTFIPWSYYMDNTYSNAPGGCNDWSASSPVRIPSTGNTKKTHYPNNDSNIAASCGSSGVIDLGSKQFDIHDHAHIRADFCSETACNPTFNNPSGDVKYLFVEGTVNFASVQTASGSGPIVLVSYGTDPATKASVCPLGGAIYLGNTNTTSAPALFMLANNGLCLDKSKFGSEKALGGISGKNLYISTNPGTPFDLGLDPSFPVDDVPIDLAWRAVRFQRL